MTLPAELIELEELGEPVERRLPEAVAAALAQSGVVMVERPPYAHGVYLIRPGTLIGVAVVAGVEVWIRPKVEIDRLLFLLGYALDPNGWQHNDVPLGEEHDLLPALAHAYSRQADRALEQGVLQGYRETEESLPVLRGRLRETEQMARRYGLAVPLEVRYDDFTVDIAENRLLLSAALRLLRLPRVPRHVRRALRRTAMLLADVTPLPPGHGLPTWQATRLNARYHTALRLAEIVLRAMSVDQTRGDVRVNGFLINMTKVFEDFVTVALAEALAGHGGSTRRQASHWLDAADRIRIRPDLVWYDDVGRPAAVADAKYKAEKPSGFPDADVYQMLAYCTALGLQVGHLIYARGNEAEQRHFLPGAAVDVRQHALDLSEPPDALLRAISALAVAVDLAAVPA